MMAWPPFDDTISGSAVLSRVDHGDGTEAVYFWVQKPHTVRVDLFGNPQHDSAAIERRSGYTTLLRCQLPKGNKHASK